MHFSWRKGRCSLVTQAARFGKELSHCCFALFLGLPLHCWFQAEQWRPLPLARPIGKGIPGVELGRRCRREWFGSQEARF